MVRRIQKGSIPTQAGRIRSTTLSSRPVVVNGARRDRGDFEISRRYWTSTSKCTARAITSASHQHGESGIGTEATSSEPDISGVPTSTDLLEVYRGMVAQGRLAYDPEQVRIVMKVGPLFG